MNTRFLPNLLRLALAALVVLAGLALPAHARSDLTPGQIRAIARDAYIYGFPMVDSYRIQYAYFVDRNNPEFKGPYNHISNVPRLFTPEDKAVQTPNSDTPYSAVGLDLRAEPMVLTIPPIDGSRYWSVQLIDLYTHNFAYLGSRTTGNGGGNYLIAGPHWKGPTPKGIAKAIRAETDLAFALYRTQLFNPADLAQVKQIQNQYRAEPLSAFLGRPAAKPAPPIDFPKPLTPDTQKSSLEFFNLLNFLLQFSPVDASEKALRANFANIGIGAGKTLDFDTMQPETKQAMQGGMADAWAEFAGLKQRIDAGQVTSGDVFGTRQELKNNYLHRMAGAVIGIYGNSRAEAMYPAYFVDGAGKKLDGSTTRYTLRFPPGQLPPVNSFWSLTLYELPASLLHANPINRYLINSPMLPDLKRDADGGVTLYVQAESPGKDKEPNWLPAPKGPFSVMMRLYWPKQDAVDGHWQPPALQAAPARL